MNKLPEHHTAAANAYNNRACVSNLVTIAGGAHVLLCTMMLQWCTLELPCYRVRILCMAMYLGRCRTIRTIQRLRL
jgi:hypothetical protein